MGSALICCTRRSEHFRRAAMAETVHPSTVREATIQARSIPDISAMGTTRACTANTRAGSGRHASGSSIALIPTALRENRGGDLEMPLHEMCLRLRAEEHLRDFLRGLRSA